MHAQQTSNKIIPQPYWYANLPLLVLFVFKESRLSQISFFTTHMQLTSGVLLALTLTPSISIYTGFPPHP